MRCIFLAAMERNQFLNMVFASRWMIDPVWGLNQLNNYFADIELLDKGASLKDVVGKYRTAPARPTFTTNQGVPVETTAEIAHIYVNGLMTVDGQMGACGRGRGMKDFAQDLEALDHNNSVKGVLLEVNSGGGEVTAAHMATEAVKSFSKPIVAFGHFVGSAAYMMSSAADEVVGAGNGAEFGSIGTMIQISNEGLRMLTEDITTIYSSLSKQKNKEIRGLLAGDNSAIMEMLDGLANNFIKEVKSHRDITNSEVFEGGMFLAKDAKKYGLIDNIGSKSKALNILNRQIKLR